MCLQISREVLPYLAFSSFRDNYEAPEMSEGFAEIKNVEKLLTLLSTNSAPREEDNEEISKLYHQTLAIRPKLIKLIEKYSQKKGEHCCGYNVLLRRFDY